MTKTQKYKSVGFCIYCSATDKKLSDEHIVPYGLGGRMILPTSSCAKCAEITGTIERSLQGRMFGPLRLKLGMRSRHKKQAPNSTFGVVDENGKTKLVRVPAEDYPKCVLGLDMPAACIVSEQNPNSISYGRPVFKILQSEFERLKRDENIGTIGADIEIGIFLRCMAKIAHAFIYTGVCEYKFDPLLTKFILGEEPNPPLTYIGGNDLGMPETDRMHSILHCFREIRGEQYTYVAVQLFSFLGAPSYGFFAGKLTDKVDFSNQFPNT